MRSRATVGLAALAAAGLLVLADPGRAQPAAPAPSHPGLTAIAATDPADVARWDQRVTRLVRNGELKLTATVRDALVAGRTHERYVQLHKGVPIAGGSLSRQVERRKAVSVFGALYGDVTLDVAPALTGVAAAEVFRKLSGSSLGPSRPPELAILPTDDGAYRLTYRARIATADEVAMVFIDAATGETVARVSELKTPAR
jgi:Zn-dependent metalloprotease